MRVDSGVAAWTLAGVLAFGLGLFGCTDQFPCGSVASNGMARICDGPGERCACLGQRCVEPTTDPTCGTGYRYRFGSQDCIQPPVFATLLPEGVDGSNGFCAGARARAQCGVAGGHTCASNQVCLCTEHRCIAPTTADAECDYRYADDGECVTPAPDASVLLYPGEQNAEGEPALCSDDRSAPCGVRRPGGGVNTCPGAQICACDESPPVCVVPATCDDGRLGYAPADTPTECISGTRLEVEVSQPGASGLCEGEETLPCGREEADDCPSGTMCLCADNRCARSDVGCPSTYRYADGERMCAPPASVRNGAVMGGGTCPANRTIECGTLDAPGERQLCPDGERCLCGAMGNRCIFSTTRGDCESGYADGATFACIDAADLEDVVVNRLDRGEGGCAGCGQMGGPTCESDEVCVCRTGQCATQGTEADGTVCYRARGQSGCLGADLVHPDLLLFPSPTAGLCPGQGVERSCGVRFGDGTTHMCDAARGESCLCDLEPGRCFIRLDRCDSGYGFAHDHECVTMDQARGIETPTRAIDGDGLCSDIPPPADGGTE